MNVAVHIQFKADRKEPLGEVIRRVAALFDRSGLQADVVASFSDGPAGIRNTSVVERALKKYPHLARFERDDAPLPDLPPARDVLRASLGARGPLKPTLVDAFTPRGYDCRGDSGTFSLRRRTAANHVVDLELDVGTWSRSLTFMFHVYGPGFTATLMPPVTLRGDDRQYPIGDTASWERIVANMAAIVDELDRTFVVEIDEAAGPAPSGSIRAANPSTCAESPSHAIGPLSLDVLPRWWRCRSSSWASSPQRHALPPRPRRPAPR
jgi:hypothetical protein